MNVFIANKYSNISVSVETWLNFTAVSTVIEEKCPNGPNIIPEWAFLHFFNRFFST